MNGVAIYLLSRGIETWRWLCPAHKEHEKRLGWDVKDERPAPFDLNCEECEFEARKEQPA